MAGEPVFAERQQIGDIADLAGTLQTQCQAALRRHADAEAGVSTSGASPLIRQRIALEPADMPVKADLTAVPVTIKVEPEGRQALFWQGEAQIASGDRKAALRRRQLCRRHSHVKPERAAGLVYPARRVNDAMSQIRAL